MLYLKHSSLIIDLFSPLFPDVPDAPERPMVKSFTSRSVELSWAPSANFHNNPISHYVVYVR